jgi:hypothetical protein
LRVFCSSISPTRDHANEESVIPEPGNPPAGGERNRGQVHLRGERIITWQ